MKHFRLTSRQLCQASLAFMLLGSTFVSGAPKVRPPATQNIAEVDADFAFLGEYMGWLDGASSPQKIGLQIVARGDGNFDAVLHEGGLPGDGGNPETIQRAIGHSEDGVMTGVVGPYRVEVSSNTARIYEGDDKLVGTLRKYDRRSKTLGLVPPSNAKVMFSGEKNDLWKNMNVTEDGLLQEGCETVDNFKDFRLHLEFRMPYKPMGEGQDRGNSGIYLQRRYEVQVLDSFGDPLAFNHCGAIYRVRQPDVNMSLPPLSWQTYDIQFRAARFDDEGNKTEDMRIRVLHNGIPIHDDVQISTKTGAGKPEGPEPLSILLQDHGNPVRYRNIWMVEGDPFADSTSTEGETYATHPEGYHSVHPVAGSPTYYGGYGYDSGWPAPYGTWPYSWSFRQAPLAPPAYFYQNPPVDLPPYPYARY